MPFVGDKTYNFSALLNSFWEEFFEDIDVLDSMFEGQMTILGQAYRDLLQQILNVNLEKTPVFREEYWHLMPVREDMVVEKQGEEFPYQIEPVSVIEDAAFITNTLYNPTIVWEKESDFIIEDGVFKFKEHPVYGGMPGANKQQVDVVPIVYYAGSDGAYDISSRTFTTTGRLFAGDNIDVDGTLFSTVEWDFTQDDVGRTIEFPETNDSTTIDRIYDQNTVEVNSAVGDRTDAEWYLLADGVFTSVDEQKALYVESGSLEESNAKVGIEEVIDDQTVKLEEPLPVDAQASSIVDDITFRVEGPDVVEEVSLWVPDAKFDFNDLYHSFGVLLDRYAPSSESYRRLIDGIFRYFMLQASIKHVESALNVMVGVPVVEEDGEEIVGFDRSSSDDYDFVRTDTYLYRLPTGSIDPELEVGDTLQEFDPLTNLFTAVDSVTRPSYLYGEHLPAGISERYGNINPNLFENVVRIPGVKRRVGDARQTIGTDYNGNRPLDEGRTAVYAGGISSNEVILVDKKFQQEDIGKSFTLFSGQDFRHTEAVVDSIRHEYQSYDDKMFTILGLDRDVGDAFEQHDILSLTTGPYGTKLLEADTSFYGREGQTVVITDNSSGYEGIVFYEVVGIRSEQVAEVEYVAGLTGSLDTVDFTSGGSLAFCRKWTLRGRDTLVNAPAYDYADIFARSHLAKITFDLNDVDVPYPRADADIQEVLLEGRPSHSYFLFESQEDEFDEVSVTEELDVTGRTNFGESFSSERFQNETDVRVGDLFAYTSSGVQTYNIDDATLREDGVLSGDTFDPDGSYTFDSSDVGKRLYFPSFPNVSSAEYRIKAVDTNNNTATIQKVLSYSPDVGEVGGTFDWKLLPSYDTHTTIPISATGSLGEVSDGVNDWVPFIQLS